MTKLEAINAMLSAIGEAPISGLDDEDLPADVHIALNILSNVTREVCAMGWQFNMEFGYELSPSDTMEWVDTSGVTTTLNVFLPPIGLLGFKVTKSCGQECLDLSKRKARIYEVDDELAMVFYDRALNRDGLDAEQYEFLYIDPIWLFDFEDMPEVAQQFVMIRAGRKLIQQSVGSTTLSGFAEPDESMAYRMLKRDFGNRDKHNMVKTQRDAYGTRRIRHTQKVDWRDSPGPVPTTGIITGTVSRSTTFDLNDYTLDANGRDVELLNSDESVVATATPDENGVYTFSDVPSGDYFVRLTMEPTDWGVSVPAVDTTPPAEGVTIHADGTFSNPDIPRSQTLYWYAVVVSGGTFTGLDFNYSLVAEG